MLAAAPRLAMALHAMLEACEYWMPAHIATDPDTRYREVQIEAVAALKEATTPGEHLLRL
jgi:hypothetical protein